MTSAAMPPSFSAPTKTNKSSQNETEPRRRFHWVQIVELLLLLLITVTGSFIRLFELTSIGLSHFDAGIYAQSGLWPWTGSFHFQQGYYSPPLYPGLIGVVNLLVGAPTDWSGALLSAVAGTLLIPVCWWIGRSWFSPTAGWMAALFVALDGFHIVFSRVGLTDELFTLLFISGLACTFVGVTKGGWLRILTAGMLVGLAWSTKYNGFLPIPLAAGFLVHPQFGARIVRLIFISLIAGLMYLPWALWFHVQHGYQNLIEHQRGYVQGWPGIVPNWGEFLHDMDIVSPPVLGICLFLVMAASIRRANPTGLMTLGLIALIGSGLEVIGWPWMVWIPAAFLGAWFGVPKESRFGFLWMLGGLLILPAIYMPYLRLWLPTETVILLLAAGGFTQILIRFRVSADDPSVSNQVLTTRLNYSLLGILALYLGLASLTTGRITFWLENAYRPHAGYRGILPEFERSRLANDRTKKGRVFALSPPPLHYLLMTNGYEVHPLSTDSSLSLYELQPDDLLIMVEVMVDWPRSSLASQALRQTDAVVNLIVDPDIITLLDEYHGGSFREELPYFQQLFHVWGFQLRNGRPVEKP